MVGVLRQLWNPVKELKVSPADRTGLKSVFLWNPVKELKVGQSYSMIKPKLIVESGEGIESSRYLNAIGSGKKSTSVWNPVKELKVHDITIVKIANKSILWNPVKELKDHRLFDIVGRGPIAVESGEGIERFLCYLP